MWAPRMSGATPEGPVVVMIGRALAEHCAEMDRAGLTFQKMDGVDEVLARQAFALAAAKLPIRTTFVQRLLG